MADEQCKPMAAAAAALGGGGSSGGRSGSDDDAECDDVHYGEWKRAETAIREVFRRLERQLERHLIEHQRTTTTTTKTTAVVPSTATVAEEPSPPSSSGDLGISLGEALRAADHDYFVPPPSAHTIWHPDQIEAQLVAFVDNFFLRYSWTAASYVESSTETRVDNQLVETKHAVDVQFHTLDTVHAKTDEQLLATVRRWMIQKWIPKVMQLTAPSTVIKETTIACVPSAVAVEPLSSPPPSSSLDSMVDVSAEVENYQRAYWDRWQAIATHWSRVAAPTFTVPATLALNWLIQRELDHKEWEDARWIRRLAVFKDTVVHHSETLYGTGAISYAVAVSPTPVGALVVAAPYLVPIGGPHLFRWILQSRVRSARALSVIVGFLKGLLLD